MALDYESIGRRVKRYRMDRKMSQEELGDLIHISARHMSNIETGTTKVSLTTIVNIANALSVTVDDLLCDSLKSARPQFERDIQRQLDTCDEYEIRLVRNVIQSVLEAVRSTEKLKPEQSGYY